MWNITDIEFTNKTDLYDYYGIDIKTIPDWYGNKMRYNRVNYKRGRVYKLVKKWIDNAFSMCFFCI